MRYRYITAFTAACLMVLLGATNVAAGAEAEGVPSFSKDVAPILFEKCVVCHRPGQIAPMSLISYKTTRPWARAIKEKVVAREMPPWFADANASVKFRNDRSLTQEQIDTIVAWADGGAPEGNATELPSFPEFFEGWRFGEPDHIFDMPIEYDIPAEGEIPTIYFYSKIPFAEDRFIDAVEMKPTGTTTVHHANIQFVELPEGTQVVNGRAMHPNGQEMTRDQANKSDVWNANSTKFISYVPGRGYEKWGRGVGKRIPADKHMVWSMHYQPTGRPEKDQTRVGIYFAKTPVTHEIFSTVISSPFPTEPTRARRVIADGQEVPYSTATEDRSKTVPPIPPHADNWKMVGIMPVLEPITVWSFQPHFHLRGKDVQYVVTYPDGREETILTVPNYNFDWQLHYELETPLQIPGGSTVISVVHFDNSVKNRYNPAPDRWVHWAEQSWDEMYSPFMFYSIDSQDLSKQTGSTDQ